ncbi:hypothetical protein MRX96_034330 [Rhipicephalus microplus]
MFPQLVANSSHAGRGRERGGSAKGREAKERASVGTAEEPSSQSANFRRGRWSFLISSLPSNASVVPAWSKQRADGARQLPQRAVTTFYAADVLHDKRPMKEQRPPRPAGKRSSSAECETEEGTEHATLP